MESLLPSKMQTRIEVINTFVSMVSQLDSLKSERNKLLPQLNIIQLDCQLITKPLVVKLLWVKYSGMLVPRSPRSISLLGALGLIRGDTMEQ